MHVDMSYVGIGSRDLPNQSMFIADDMQSSCGYTICLCLSHWLLSDHIR